MYSLELVSHDAMKNQNSLVRVVRQLEYRMHVAGRTHGECLNVCMFSTFCSPPANMYLWWGDTTNHRFVGSGEHIRHLLAMVRLRNLTVPPVMYMLASLGTCFRSSLVVHAEWARFERVKAMLGVWICTHAVMCVNR
jgi:hypothetical protein